MTTSKRQLATDLGLTALEADILCHRLEVPDAISDALNGEETVWHPDDVQAVCDVLLETGLRAACDINESLAHAVLEDAVTGSTYFGAASAESDQKQSAIYAAGGRLAEKIGRLVGRELSYPWY
jgi:hypothetical protein